MNPGTVIAPIVVLIAGGIWLATQTASISRLESENADLGKRIAAKASRPEPIAPAAGEKPRRNTPGAPAAKAKDPIDWKAVAARFSEMQSGGGITDMREMIRFQQRLQGMTTEELIAALDEIAGMDLPEPSRMMLEQTLIGPLIEKDPRLALNRYLDRIHDDRSPFGWTLSNALGEWAKKDPAAAASWFDGEIAAGRFDSKSLDGKSRARANFEGAFISTLLGSDPAAASQRLAALPEDQRGDVLEHHLFSNVKEKDQPAFAKLVRDQLPQKEQAEAIAKPAGQIAATGDYPKVTEYLDRIQATPEERATAVEKAAESRLANLGHAGKITTAQIDEMRTWATTQAPGSEDKTTGKALAQIAGFNDKTKYADAAKLAEHYHEASGSDEVLTHFLDGWAARSNKELARPLAEKIRDDKKREEILKKLQ